MEILLTLASVAASSAKGLLSKRLSVASSDVRAFGRVNALMSFCALVIVSIYAVIAGVPGISAMTVILALLYAMFTLAAQLFYMCALRVGDVSAVTFFYSCGFVIPTCAGTFLYGEECGAVRLLGVLLLIAAFWLNAGGRMKLSGRGWIFPALAAMVSSGAVGLIQKVHQSSAAKAELGGFLVIAFAACTLVSLSMTFPAKPGAKLPPLPTLSCGVCIGAANIINTHLSGILPAVIFFPAVNGGVVIVSAIAARLIFGERIGRRRILALCIGMAAIGMIAM